MTWVNCPRSRVRPQTTHEAREYLALRGSSDEVVYMYRYVSTLLVSGERERAEPSTAPLPSPLLAWGRIDETPISTQAWASVFDAEDEHQSIYWVLVKHHLPP